MRGKRYFDTRKRANEILSRGYLDVDSVHEAECVDAESEETEVYPTELVYKYYDANGRLIKEASESFDEMGYSAGYYEREISYDNNGNVIEDSHTWFYEWGGAEYKSEYVEYTYNGNTLVKYEREAYDNYEKSHNTHTVTYVGADEYGDEVKTVYYYNDDNVIVKIKVDRM